jgi:hypothetical protein
LTSVAFLLRIDYSGMDEEACFWLSKASWKKGTTLLLCNSCEVDDNPIDKKGYQLLAHVG